MISRIPVRLRVKLTVHDGEVELDATATDPQVGSAYNLPTQGLVHPWLVVRLTRVILTHEKNIPLNYGIYRHFRAVNPPVQFSMRRPAPRSWSRFRCGARPQ